MSYAAKQANRKFGQVRVQDWQNTVAEVTNTGVGTIVAVTYPAAGDFGKLVATADVLVDIHVQTYIDRNNLNGLVGCVVTLEYSEDSGSTWTSVDVSGSMPSCVAQGCDGADVTPAHARSLQIVKLLTGLTTTTLRVRLKTQGSHGPTNPTYTVIPSVPFGTAHSEGVDSVDRFSSTCLFTELTPIPT